MIPEDVYSLARSIMAAKKRKELLEKHPYKLYEGKDGRWFSRFPKKEGGSYQKAFKSKKEAEDFIVSFYEVKERSIREIFKEALDKKIFEGSISESTACTYRVIFKRHFYDFGDQMIDRVSVEALESFIKEQKVINNLGVNGYANLLRVIRIIFKHAKKTALISFSPDDIIRGIEWGRNAFRKPVRDIHDEVFDDEEVRKLSLYFKEKPTVIHLGLLLLFVTGLRIGELSALKWDDVSEDGLFVHRTEVSWVDENHKTHCEVSDSPKTAAGNRFVPLPSQASWIIEELRACESGGREGNYIFMKRGKRVRSAAFRRALNMACDNVGIVRRSPHKIRKTYASILLDSGIATKVITDSMGHTSISVTNTSYARKRKTTKQVAEAIKGVKEFDLVRL